MGGVVITEIDPTNTYIHSNSRTHSRMPSNTDNSGSARAARLRQISAARGPVPVIRPNIGSMALDARLGGGLKPSCCPSSEPVYPTYYLQCSDSDRAIPFPPDESPLPVGPFYLDALGFPGDGLIQLTCYPSGTIILATSLNYLVTPGLPDGTTNVTYEYSCSSEPIFLSCGIPSQTLIPSTAYYFLNNTGSDPMISGANLTLHLTPSSGPIIDISVNSLDILGPYTNLVSYNTGSTSDCSQTQYIGVFGTPGPFCILQQLNPALTYYFEPLFDQIPITILYYIEGAPLPGISLTLTDTNPVGPFTNLTSWQPDNGCPPP